jgi:F0F1-type ATP synthase assembly protein I
MSENSNQPRKSLVVAFGELTAVAWEFLGSILAGAALGYLADRALGTDPWLLIVLTLLGTCTGFYRMVRMLKHFERDA